MKVVFYASDKPREIMLAKALERAVRRTGDEFEIRRTGDYGETPDGDDLLYPGPSPDTDVACCFGVKGRSKQIIVDHRAVGKGTLFFDKGYSRGKGEGGHTEYSRISVNATDPLAYMMKQRRSDRRFRLLGVKLGRYSAYAGGHVLICGSSQKYHEFHKLDEPDTYAQKLVRVLRKHTQRQIIYRPKPSWKGARPIAGTSFSSGGCSIADALRGCHAVVTHGSAAAMDAVMAGVPAIVLGPSIALPVAEEDLAQVEQPRFPAEDERQRWCNAMAYCQWTTDELRDGSAWQELKAELTR